MVKVEILEDDFINVSDNIIADSVLYKKIEFIFPKNWEDAVKTAVFINGETTINVILDNNTPLYVSKNVYYIPHEVIKTPGFSISIFGIRGNSVLTTNKGVVKVSESGLVEGQAPADPTPSEYEQLIRGIAETKRTSQTALDTANSNSTSKNDKFCTVFDGGASTLRKLSGAPVRDVISNLEGTKKITTQVEITDNYSYIRWILPNGQMLSLGIADGYDVKLQFTDAFIVWKAKDGSTWAKSRIDCALPINMKENRIYNLPDPSEENDAAHKKYVDEKYKTIVNALISKGILSESDF